MISVFSQARWEVHYTSRIQADIIQGHLLAEWYSAPENMNSTRIAQKQNSFQTSCIISTQPGESMRGYLIFDYIENLSKLGRVT